MIPVGGMLIGTGLGVIAEIATSKANTQAMTPGERWTIALGFGFLAGLAIAYSLESHQQDAAAKGQLKI